MSVRFISLAAILSLCLTLASCEPTYYEAPIIPGRSPIPYPLGAVELQSDKSEYRIGETVRAFINNRGGQHVYLPGCNNVILEWQQGDRWLSRFAPCLQEGNSQVITSGRQELSVPVLSIPIQPQGTYRLRADVSFACQINLPLTQARCLGGETIYSPSFTAR